MYSLESPHRPCQSDLDSFSCYVEQTSYVLPTAFNSVSQRLKDDTIPLKVALWHCVVPVAFAELDLFQSSVEQSGNYSTLCLVLFLMEYKFFKRKFIHTYISDVVSATSMMFADFDLLHALAIFPFFHPV